MSSELHSCPHCLRSILIEFGDHDNPTEVKIPPDPKPEYPQSYHMLLERDHSGRY